MDELVFRRIDFEKENVKYRLLDVWCDYYGWSVYKYDYNYVLYDNQAGCIVDTYKDRDLLIRRICSRALDYWCNEYEGWDEQDFTIDDYTNLVQYVYMYINASYPDNINEIWLKSIVKFINEMEVK